MINSVSLYSHIQESKSQWNIYHRNAIKYVNLVNLNKNKLDKESQHPIYPPWPPSSKAPVFAWAHLSQSRYCLIACMFGLFMLLLKIFLYSCLLPLEPKCRSSWASHPKLMVLKTLLTCYSNYVRRSREDFVKMLSYISCESWGILTQLVVCAQKTCVVNKHMIPTTCNSWICTRE